MLLRFIDFLNFESLGATLIFHGRLLHKADAPTFGALRELLIPNVFRGLDGGT